jgi:hypothetical protein
MTAQQKRSAERRGHNELSLSKEALKAFQHFKARAGLADDSQAILALLQQAEPENLFDDTTPQDFFRGSEQPGFKEPLTERALVRRATQVLGVPLSQLIRSGAILLAKRELLTRTNLTAGTEADALRSGVAGSADHRMEQAFQTLSAAGKPLSPARLAKLSRTNFFSAQRWLQLHHPELLLQKSSEPPEATKLETTPPPPPPAPKPPAQTSPKSPQQPAKSSPAGSTAPKTKKPAKRVRNPENPF